MRDEILSQGFDDCHCGTLALREEEVVLQEEVVFWFLS